jgi:CDP-diacylglycerol--serine O-phosphatidyltransferase
MPFKRHIPNALTICNLLMGCLSILAASERSYTEASYFIFAAAVFDFLDGFAARILKASSAIGKELDSLSDVVSFGVAPCLLLFFIYLDKLYLFNQIGKFNIASFLIDVDLYLVMLTSFGIVICSALRLAKFNIDTRQSYHFIGLPTPANALFIACIPFILHTHVNNTPIEALFLNTYFATGMNLLLSYLLVSPIRLMSLKTKAFSFYAQRYLLLWLGLSLMFVVVFQFLAAPIVLVLYFLISQLHFIRAGVK